MGNEKIADFFERDHRRLDELFADFHQTKGVDAERAKALFAQFRAGLAQHMAWEEAVLFPEYDDRVQAEGRGATEELRNEHAQILNQLDLIEDKLRAGDLQTAREEARLLKFLSEHNRSEENGLYGRLDGLLNDRERAELFAQMQQAVLE